MNKLPWGKVPVYPIKELISFLVKEIEKNTLNSFQLNDWFYGSFISYFVSPYWLVHINVLVCDKKSCRTLFLVMSLGFIFSKKGLNDIKIKGDDNKSKWKRQFVL